MLGKNDVARIYETVMSTPGMNDAVRLTFNIPRKNVLLLSKVIDRGLSNKEVDDKFQHILDVTPKENLDAIAALATELLDKAGLTPTSQKLQSL